MIFSVIIPIYNVEEYITECIESVINQTYPHIEIILVDDGSPDNCPGICDEYAVKDSRIRVIHKSNGGLSDARNVGMEIASGDYIIFVDSDDKFENLNVLSKINTYLIQYNYPDILTTNTGVGITNPVCGVEFLKALLNRWSRFPEKIDVVVWDKIFKRSFLVNTGILFPVGLVHEDDYWTLAVISQASMCAEVVTDLCFHRINSASISRAPSQQSILKRAISKMKNSLNGCEFSDKNRNPRYDKRSVYDFYCATYLSGLSMGKRLSAREYIQEFEKTLEETKSMRRYFRCAKKIKYKIIWILSSVFGMKTITKIMK